MLRRYAFLAFVAPFHIFVFQAVGVLIGSLFSVDAPLPLVVLLVPAITVCMICDALLLTLWVGYRRLLTVLLAVIAGCAAPPAVSLLGIHQGVFTPFEALLAAIGLTIGLYWLILRSGP